MRTPYERLVAEGKVQEPWTKPPVDLRRIQRATMPASSTELIADTSGER